MFEIFEIERCELGGFGGVVPWEKKEWINISAPDHLSENLFSENLDRLLSGRLG